MFCDDVPQNFARKALARLFSPSNFLALSGVKAKVSFLAMVSADEGHFTREDKGKIFAGEGEGKRERDKFSSFGSKNQREPVIFNDSCAQCDKHNGKGILKIGAGAQEY